MISSLGLAPLTTKEIFPIISDLRKTGMATLLIEQNAPAALQVPDHGYAVKGQAAEMAKIVIETCLGLAKKTA